MDSHEPKSTSYAYGDDHQIAMLKFFYESKEPGESNHSYQRVVLAERLVEKFLEKSSMSIEEIQVVDVGCSVGQFAIHFAKKGFKAIGLDFDDSAIRLANELKVSEGCDPLFINADVSDPSVKLPPIDIAICFDIFEHLHDDELGSLLVGLKHKLNKEGCVVFHTHPLEYDYLFWNRKLGIIECPILLRPFIHLPERYFTKIVRAYAILIDLGMMLILNKTYKEHIKKHGHCNPLTFVRLLDIFNRAGYDVGLIESGFISPQFKNNKANLFKSQPITHRSLWGIATPKSKQ